jgi:hypothetical protein
VVERSSWGPSRYASIRTLSVSSHSLFGDSVHMMRSVLSGYQGGAAIFRAVSPPRRGWTKFATCAVASYEIRSDGPREAALLSTLRSTLWQTTSSLWPHGLASFSSKLPGLWSEWRCAVARRSLRSPTNCVGAQRASSLRPPPLVSLRSWRR